MPARLDQIWDDIREELRSDTPDFKFQIWIEPLELAGIRGKTLFVRAPEHIRTSVSERYLPLLRRAAASRFDRRAVVQVVDAQLVPPAAESRATFVPGRSRVREAAAFGRLNPKYTFEQFVIGEGNRFAHAAALAVAELPAQAYNPLFLHGPPGLGKTHLLHAIGNFVQRFGTGLRVRYATSEEFTTEFVDAVRVSPHRRLQGGASAARTWCSSTTSSSWPGGPRRARSSSTRSTRCSTPAGSW